MRNLGNKNIISGNTKSAGNAANESKTNNQSVKNASENSNKDNKSKVDGSKINSNENNKSEITHFQTIPDELIIFILLNYCDLNTVVTFKLVSKRYQDFVKCIFNTNAYIFQKIPHLDSLLDALDAKNQDKTNKVDLLAVAKAVANGNEAKLKAVLKKFTTLTLYYPTYLPVVPQFDKKIQGKTNTFYLSLEDAKSDIRNYADVKGFYRIKFLSTNFNLFQLLKNGSVMLNCDVHESNVVERLNNNSSEDSEGLQNKR